MNSIPCPLQAHAQSFHKKNTVLISSNKEISYLQLHEKVCSTAQYLQTFGIKEGTRVGIISNNSLEFIILFYSLIRLKAVAVCLSTRLPEKSIQDYVEYAGCTFLVTFIRSLLNSVEIKITKLFLDDVVSFPAFSFKDSSNEPIYLSPDSPATILYTSGSSSNPKAVLHSLGNHIFNALGSNEHIPLSKNDSWLLNLPNHHVSGIGIIWRVLLSGARIVLPDPQNNLAENIINTKPTHSSMVPTQFLQVLNDAGCVDHLKKMKCILIGGAPIAENIIKEAVKLQLPVYLSYGLTEMASQVATSENISTSKEIRSAKVLKYRELKFSPDGEILVKGKTLFKGYVNKNSLELPFDREGWFKTGDLGKEVSPNHIIVTGRKDNMFISGGENIQPEEIERFLKRIASIEEVVVVAIENTAYGFRPIALIKIKKGTNLTKHQVIQNLSIQLEKFKIPDYFFLMPKELENPQWKTNRSQIRSWVVKNYSALETLE